jgi:lipopolysaccharide transport system permease protein
MHDELTVLGASRGWRWLNIGELWRYRELLYFLVWRTIKIRYKQTVIGVAWAIVQPLVTMIVFSLFFGRLAGIPSDGVPYPVFCLTGLVAWTFFAFGLNESANSLVVNQQLITKVYFPRLAIPIAGVLAGLVDFVFAFLLLVVVMMWYGLTPGVRVLWIPAFVGLALIASLSVGLWLSALNVQYRDVRYMLPFLTQLWLFITPIAYSSSLLSPTWRTVYGLNPMVGVVEGFRWALLDTEAPGAMVAVSAIAACALALGGALYFRRMERTFADVI